MTIFFQFQRNEQTGASVGREIRRFRITRRALRFVVPTTQSDCTAVQLQCKYFLLFLIRNQLKSFSFFQPIRQNPNARGTFFESWCSRYVDIGRRARRPSTLPTMGSSASSGTPVLEKLSDEVILVDDDKVDGHLEQLTAEQCVEIIQKLKLNQQGWIPNSSR